MDTLLKVLITASMLLTIAKYYLHDTKQVNSQSVESIQSKEQLDQLKQQLNDINAKADEDRKKALKDLGI